NLDRIALICLAVQHASSSWGYRCAEFAFPLYFVALFPATLLPASIYGLLLLLASLFLSPLLGSWIDATKHRRLTVVRTLIVAQKTTVAISYAGFISLLMTGSDSIVSHTRWGSFAALTACGALVVLSNTGLTVAIERDWVSTIAEGHPPHLTRLNTIIRRIDLLSKLLAPLFVSLLTSTAGDGISAVVLLATNGMTLVFELIWIGVVYQRFAERLSYPAPDANGNHMRFGGRTPLASLRQCWPSFKNKTRTFLALPTLPTTIALALLYTSVLSFDSTFLTYLKQPHAAASGIVAKTNGIIIAHSGGSTISYTDAFISGMRGLCVVMGLAGTFIMPCLERRIGLIRTGSWSLAQETLSLVPTVTCLYIGVGLGWNTALLFTGLALSRIGLWSYDLTQLSILQNSLYGNANANFHFAMQQSLINLFDLSHFVLTLVWSKPDDFRKPATVSLGLLGAAWFVYILGYARKQRGHLLHLEGWQRLLPGKER
ncbi:hypothetical protein BDZ90DRAFT_212048, partial [Jaminaea rosea]